MAKQTDPEPVEPDPWQEAKKGNEAKKIKKKLRDDKRNQGKQ